MELWKKRLRTVVILTVLFNMVIADASSQVGTPDDVGLDGAVAESVPATTESPSDAEESALDLDAIEVSGAGLTLRQEVGLRLIRSALESPQSLKWEARNNVVCRITVGRGVYASRLKYLSCGRNGDLGMDPQAGYGHEFLLTSSRHVIKAKLYQEFAQLEGPEGFDEEFVALALQGHKLTRDIPGEQELEKFAEAYRVVNLLHRRGRSEALQIKAIEDRGLSLDRYNHIAGLTETFASIRNDIAARLE